MQESHRFNALLAVFLSLEVKVDDAELTDRQADWAAAVIKAGGIAGRVSELEDAEVLINAYHPRMIR